MEARHHLHWVGTADNAAAVSTVGTGIAVEAAVLAVAVLAVVV